MERHLSLLRKIDFDPIADTLHGSGTATIFTLDPRT